MRAALLTGAQILGALGVLAALYRLVGFDWALLAGSCALLVVATLAEVARVQERPVVRRSPSQSREG